MKGLVVATILELGQGLDGPNMTVLFPGDSTHAIYPLISHLRPDGRALTAGERVNFDGDRYGATKAWIDGVLVSARDWRSKRAWRAVKPGP